MRSIGSWARGSLIAGGGRRGGGWDGGMGGVVDCLLAWWVVGCELMLGERGDRGEVGEAYD